MMTERKADIRDGERQMDRRGLSGDKEGGGDVGGHEGGAGPSLLQHVIKRLVPQKLNVLQCRRQILQTEENRRKRIHFL